MIGLDIHENDGRGTVCSNANFSSATVENIFAAMGFRLIKVLKGPSICPLFHQPEEPELYYDKYIDKDAAYIIAGMGVVSGEEAYKKLNDGNTVLWWE